MVESADDVEQLLRGHRAHDLLGERERSWLDFKQSPYVLGEERGKSELAKDVTALANSGGGCIVIGVRTRKDPSDVDEIADKVSPFPCDLVDAAHYHAIVNSSIYPPVDGVRVETYQVDSKCLAIVVVPEQDEDQEPFMLVRVVDDAGKRVEAIAVPYRSGSQTRWAPPGQLHRDLADGRRSRRLPPATIPVEDAATGRESFAVRMRARASEIEAFMQWEDRAIFMLSATPKAPPPRIEGFYDPEGIRGALARPPELRHAGFGIGWAAEPQVESGSLVAFDSSRCRWLDPDGFFSVGLVADQRVLGRAPHPKQEAHRLQVHPTALVEFTYEFCRFTAEQLVPAVETGWRVGLLVVGAKTRPWSLQLGRGSAFDWSSNGSSPASTDDWLKRLPASGDPARDAYQLLAHAYDLFGQPESAIPYVSAGRVDVDAILALSQR